MKKTETLEPGDRVQVSRTFAGRLKGKYAATVIKTHDNGLVQVTRDYDKQIKNVTKGKLRKL